VVRTNAAQRADAERRRRVPAVPRGRTHVVTNDAGAAGTRRRAEEILAGLSEVQPHDDAASALERLAREGIRVAALTNGGRQQTEEILKEANLLDRFERTFSVSDVGAYKPDRRRWPLPVAEPRRAALLLEAVEALLSTSPGPQ
jgi:FMN phosphatase YigB (HAD superfamily)